MTDPIQRIRAHFPTIQITMVSIVVALALQELLDRLPTIDALWEPSWIAARIWCQAFVAFAIIIKMWSGFVLNASISERVPGPIDLLGPMGILVFVDAQIASIGVDGFARWAYILGAGSLVAAAYISSQRITTASSAVTATAARRAFRSIPNPAFVEAWIAAAALAAGLAHQTLQLGERGLLIAAGSLLVVEAASAIGPIFAWRVLRQIEQETVS